MKTLEMDGKKYKLVEIEEESKPHKTGYERNENGPYYLEGTKGNVISVTDRITPSDNQSFNSANYYADEQLAKDNIRADALMRNLRRFSAEGRKRKICWGEKYFNKFYIVCAHNSNNLMTWDNKSCSFFGVVYFDTKELAKAAIEKYRDELMWYFTEYQDTAEFRDAADQEQEVED